MSRERVRRLGSNVTHISDVAETVTGHFIKDFTAAALGSYALCGVNVGNAVVMRAGAVATCRACRHIDQTERDRKANER